MKIRMIVRALTVTAGAAAAILLPATASLADGGAGQPSYGQNNGGGLPVTGFPFATFAAVGVVLLLVGAVLVVAYRRRDQTS